MIEESLYITEELEKIRRLSNRLWEYETAARQCIMLFERRYRSGEENYLFLDADVICGALPSLQIGDFVQYASSFDNGDELALETVFGPHLLEYLFQSMTRYCIPPGALAEILIRKERAFGALNIRASKFLQFIDHTARTQNPARAFLGSDEWGHGNIVDVIHENIDGFCSKASGFNVFSRLLERATPIEQLLGATKGEDVGKAFSSAYTHFSRNRPRYPRNNYFDALNVETVVQVSRHGRDSGVQGKRLWPVLISSTQAMRQFESSLHRFLPGGEVTTVEGKQNIIQGPLFMVVARAFDLMSPESPRVSADRAKVFTHAVEKLHKTVGYYEDELNKQRRASPEEYIIHTNLNDQIVEQLSRRSRTFMETWGPKMRHCEDLISRDRSVLVNEVLDGEITRRLSSKSSTDVADGLKSLASKIRALKDPFEGIWECIWANRPQRAVTLSTTPLWGTVELFYSRNVGLQLSEMADGILLDDSFAEIWNREVIDFRVWARSTALGPGAFFACDVFEEERPSGARVLICLFIWKHSKAQRDVVDAIKDSFVRIRGIHDTSFSLIGTCDNARHLLESSAHWQDVYEASSSSDCYLEIGSGEWRWFFEFISSSESEQQIGIAVPVAYCDPATINAIATLVSITSTRQLKPEIYVNLIESIVRYIRQLNVEFLNQSK